MAKRRTATYKDWIKPDGLTILEGWARDGLIDEQISHNIGIHPSTLYDWKKKYPEIDEALKKGKEVVDIEVENALLGSALGYNAIEEQAIKTKKVFYEDGKRCEEETVEIVELLKHIPANTTAQIFWLKNRKPSEWRDRQDLKVEGKMETNVNKLDGILEQLKD